MHSVFKQSTLPDFWKKSSLPNTGDYFKGLPSRAENNTITLPSRPCTIEPFHQNFLPHDIKANHVTLFSNNFFTTSITLAKNWGHYEMFYKKCKNTKLHTVYFLNHACNFGEIANYSAPFFEKKKISKHKCKRQNCFYLLNC